MRRRMIVGYWMLGLLVPFASLNAAGEATVRETMDGIVTRLYATLSPQELLGLTQDKILTLITPEEKQILATKESYFDVNVPVTVSVIRSSQQNPVPFWLEEAGFVNTGDQVVSEWYTHEVWQKDFDAGRVELGINGFDNERKAYFVCVGPKNPGDTVEITHLYPDEAVITMGAKAWTYRDWNNLYIDEYPAYLEGQQLLTTFRGRGKAAHLVGAFRQTEYPSSPRPDQVALTWSEDPRHTQTIQWRTDTSVKDGVVRLMTEDGEALREIPAEIEAIEDRMLMNDRYIHHFTADVRGLDAGTSYRYRAGSPSANVWSEEFEFRTAPDGNKPFSFIYTGDTHNSESWGELLPAAFARYPEAAFNIIGGDVVSSGLNRAQWDQVFHYGRDIYCRKPLAFSLGNHDDQDGLGVGMILSMWRFPANGPEGVERGRMYTFQYSNAEFFVVDVGTPIATVRGWLEDVLSKSTATWKFFIYHFPLYNDGEDDYSHVAEQWAPLFDEYHVDLCMHGHFHRYFRTKPIRGGRVVGSPAEGTIYLHTSGVASQEPIIGNTDIAAVFLGRGQLYQKIDIDGNRLVFQTRDVNGQVMDEFTIEK